MSVGESSLSSTVKFRVCQVPVVMLTTAIHGRVTVQGTHTKRARAKPRGGGGEENEKEKEE